MVKALHEAGLEVILDIVFNHTGEGDERGATFCWRGLDNPTYYLLEPKTGKYLNYSGCGNTLNCNHPVLRNQILAALRYWVTEMHVDGFRFDLASILGRGRDGEVLPNPPLLEAIAGDPVMADVKLIAEAWDAAGLYQVGSFPSWGRWAEWNGRFRDEVRRFVKSDPGLTKLLATRLAGSPDLYRGSERAPWHSINFLTSHDGFTLADLVTYNDRHNWENGEGNTDGHPENLSWNCGEEGPSSRLEVNALRRRQQRNFLALLFLSQGVPMLLAGDEFVAHAARQQQRLLPGQRDLLGRLVAPRAERGPLPVHAAAHPVPQGAPLAAAADVPRGRGEAPARVARDEAREARLDRRVADAGRAPPRGERRRADLRDRQRPLGSEDVRAAEALAGERVVPVRGHEPLARRGRARAGSRDAGRRGPLHGRSPVGGGARREVGPRYLLTSITRKASFADTVAPAVVSRASTLSV